MRRTVLLAAVASISLWMAPLPGQATEVTTHVVDDDKAQCAEAGYTSIGAAVTAANPGDLIRVCAGSYPERVAVDKPVVIKGQPEAVEAIDCFAPSASTRGDLDTTVLPVVSPPDATAEPLLRLAADGVEVSGLVFEGMVDPGVNSIYRASLETSPLYSGYRVHHNLFRLNTLGMETASNGAIASRFDHNCLRENGWAIANQRYPLGKARLDHNETFRQRNIAFEMGWVLAGVEDVRLDHNVSRLDGYGFFVEASSRVLIEDNVVQARLFNVAVNGGNRTVQISRNSILPGGTLGVFFRPLPQSGTTAPSEDVLVEGNTIHGMIGNPGSGIAVSPLHPVRDAHVRENVLSDNQGDGLRVNSGSGNTYSGNVMERNGGYGATAGAGAAGNTFLGNVMLDNGTADAHEAPAAVGVPQTELRNDWIDNVCERDLPAGLICGMAEQP